MESFLDEIIRGPIKNDWNAFLHRQYKWSVKILTLPRPDSSHCKSTLIVTLVRFEVSIDLLIAVAIENE